MIMNNADFQANVKARKIRDGMRTKQLGRANSILLTLLSFKTKTVLIAVKTDNTLFSYRPKIIIEHHRVFNKKK